MALRKYIIERDIPAVGSFDRDWSTMSRGSRYAGCP